MHSKRNFGLDLLRAMAITGVFFAHGVTSMGRFGNGVDLFFVLSGFLIGRIYFRSRKAHDFKILDFWVARWWRTLPPYLAALGLFALSSYWIPGNPVAWYYLLFLQTFLGLKGFGPSWSLCVEEHFYLALPPLALAAEAVFGLRRMKWVLPIAFVLPTILRAVSFAAVGGIGNMPDQWYRMTYFHCEGLIAGVYLAYLFVEEPTWFAKCKGIAWAVSPLVIVASVGADHFAGQAWFETFYVALLALGFAGWLRLAYDLYWEPKVFVGRVVEWVVRATALASYSIYLVHVLIMTNLRILVDAWPRGVLKSGFILAATVVLCLPFYFLIEKPSIITRDRYRARQKAAEAVRVTSS